MLHHMDKKVSPKTRTLRVSMALSKREQNLIKRAAKVVGERPTTFMRMAAKQVARSVLARAGVKIRLDRPISAQVPQEVDDVAEPV
jgi:uncharacterized protein (DUF1778 family)